MWSGLPVLTWRTIQTAGDRLHSEAVPREMGKVYRAETSGSTGEPVRLYRTELDRLMWEAIFPEEFADPDSPPDISAFFAARAELNALFDSVLDAVDLDGLVFPQATRPVPDLGGPGIGATTVSEINVLGIPGVTVPAGCYADGSPFSLIFVGKMWSEAELLAFAYDNEQATFARVAPSLVPIPAAAPLFAAGLLVLGARTRHRPAVATDSDRHLLAA